MSWLLNQFNMGANIEIIAPLVPKNDANFGVVDVNYLKGGYVQVQTIDERDALLEYTDRLKEGMLCFVVESKLFFQLMGGKWENWSIGGEMQLQSVAKAEDLWMFEQRGQVIYVEEYNALRYYDGDWRSFTQVYIQDTPPNDKGGIWIDTSGGGLSLTNSVTSSLLKIISCLTKRVKALEYREQQIQSGEVSNNMFNLYDEIVGIDPGSEILDDIDEDDYEGTTEQEDMDEEFMLLNTLLADSQEPTYYKDTLPNVKHIQIKWGSYSSMQQYADCFQPAELIFAHNTNELWIKHPKTLRLVRIGSTVSGPDEPIEEDIMEGIIQNGDYIGSIAFVDVVNPNKHYTFTVQNGEVDLEEQELNDEPVASSQEKAFVSNNIQYYKGPYIPTYTRDASGAKIKAEVSATNSLLHINMIYAAGYDKYNPINFNFIELANLTKYDVNLNGFFLHYSQGAVGSGVQRKWVSLPLRGQIKAYSTYLIRCARSGDDKFAKIKVGKPDVYFSKGTALNPTIFESNDTTVWDGDGNLIINKCCSLLLTGPAYPTVDSSNYTDSKYTLTQLRTTPYSCSTPWSSDPIGLVYGFCDLVGFGKAGSVDMPSIVAPVAELSNTKLYLRYYALDNVSQAYKAQNSADSTAVKFWKYVDLVNTDKAISLDGYVPKNSKEGKNIFFNKHLIEGGKPQFVNCTFGYNAHTTRCFAWVTKGYRDEFLRYKVEGTTDWTVVESFKAGDKRSNKNNRGNAIYNRIRSVTTDGTYFTAHKCIIDVPEPTQGTIVTYTYQVGYKDNWTDERTFTVRNRQDVINNGFQFLQVTDQQGFNQEEYEEWRLVAEYTNKHYCNNYTYERSSNLDGQMVSKIPTPKADAPQDIVVKQGYYIKKTKTTTTYDYRKCDAKEGALKIYLSKPTATATSDDYIIVGNLWQKVDGAYQDIDESGVDFVWPSQYDIVEVLPSPETGAEYVMVGGYYEKFIASEDTTYSYEEAEEGEVDAKVPSLPTATASTPNRILVGTPYTLIKQNLEFVINTGDATQNGNRVNEWIDYFNAGDSLFSHLEQMYEVGNNDLCPVTPYELGLGNDATKQNPINVNYFFTFEHPFQVPTSSTGVYVPCVYSFIYGNTYFLGMNSELTDASEACYALFGQQGKDLYATLNVWAQNDLEHLDDSIKWKIAFCHESPFTLLIKTVMDSWNTWVGNNPNTDPTNGGDRGSVTSHFNNPGDWWFSKFLEDNAFNMSICGHKHTYTNSRYICDNPKRRMQPYVYDPAGAQASFITENNKNFMQVTNDIHRHYVKYVMCQASGYKLTSNKELPGQNIGWLLEYYPITDAAGVNTNQRYPHYIVWHIGEGTESEDPTKVVASRPRILGRAKKVYADSYTQSAGNNKMFNYNSLNITSDNLVECGGNGSTNPYNNIICDILPYEAPPEQLPEKLVLVDADNNPVVGFEEIKL